MTWRWQGIQLKGAQVSTAPDFRVYERLEVTGFDDMENEILLDLRFSESLGRYYIGQLTLKAFDESEEITGARLREIPVLALSRDSLDGGGVVEFSDGGIFDTQAVADAASDIISGGPSSDEAMLATARVYRYAQIMQRSPAKAVQATLGLTAPTATLWIRRARAQGLLGNYGDADG